MQKNYSTALHIFRRDLRLHDNTALLHALNHSQSVIPCFIFDKRQIENNEYKSENGIEFMINSLNELNARLNEKKGKLYFFYGITEEILERLISENKIQSVFINRDYTPFSLERDKRIEKICLKYEIDFYCFADALLQEPEEVFKPNGKPYTIFTHFYNKAACLSIAKPKKNQHENYYNKKIEFSDTHVLEKLSQLHNSQLLVKGGRIEATALLKKVITLRNYQDTRNIPALNATTKLSAHNKFGTLSIRELYTVIANQFGKEHTLIKELYWRDFFTHIAFHFPHVFGHAFIKKYGSLPWSENEKHFHAWCEGYTGFPIVDAGMRELNTTGFMHNRVRMITASFLVKDLHIDWRWGEKYFAQKLVDYDPAVNNGNWQWAASTGCDSQPYFRIFNPWLQQKKYDADCIYIKRWIKELENFSAKKIHGLEKNNANIIDDYPRLIVDHAIESQKAKQIYRYQDEHKIKY